MANNSSSGRMGMGGVSAGCDTKWYSMVGAELELPIYYVLAPTCLFFGLIGRILCFIAFYHQSKTEPAYFYQVSLTVGELFDILTNAGYVMVMICGWNLDHNAAWCLSNYSYLWYEAHLAVPLIRMTNLTKQFQAMFMAADRLVALWKPIIYRSLNQNYLRISSVLVSVVIGVSANIFDLFRYNNPQLRRGTYIVDVNLAYLGTTIAKVLSELRDVTAIVQLILLIILNVAMVRIYLKQKREIDAILGQTEDARKKRSKKRGDNSLLMISMSQCFFTAISILATVVYYGVFAAKPTFDLCEASLWGPILDSVIWICDIAEFAFIMAFSRYFRRIIREAIPCFKGTIVSSLL